MLGRSSGLTLALVVVGCDASPASRDATEHANLASAGATEIAPVTWARCSLGDRAPCVFGLPSGYPLLPASMSAKLLSALGDSCVVDVQSPTCPAAFVRPEGFPYQVQLQLGTPPNLSGETYTLEATLATLQDSVEAPTPFPLWRVEVENPDLLDFSFEPTTGASGSRSIAPYTTSTGATSVAYVVPRLGEGVTVFIAPSEAAVEGNVMLFDSNTPVTIAGKIDGSGTYEVTRAGIRRADD